MKNSIVKLDQIEIDSISGGGMLVDCANMVMRDVAFPAAGLLIGYGIIKILSRPHNG